ncbi:MAG TPA: PIG-L family deacetylase [Rhodanobacteraceae bacterium]|nr:PIG-L family deacetylase [Rhodanobacteraceae bacterium]
MNLDQLLAAPDACLLIVAPHPDDESLAAGGVIQRALAHGARVHIVFVTDGDNNPWPQRLLERRLRIGARERERWGARRRGEAQCALRELGAEAVAVHRLGWADGGVTWKLVDETADAIAQWRTLLAEIAPTLLVLPDLADGHPDHSALHVLMELVLNGMPETRRPQCLCYLLHGHAGIDDMRRVAFALTDQEQTRKRAAIHAHASQIALSRRRLLRFATAREHFAVGVGNCLGDGGLSGPRLPWQPPRGLRSTMVLLAVDAQGGQRIPCKDARAANLFWRNGASAARAGRSLQAPYYIKLYSSVPSPWVFDVWGWRRFVG